MKMFDAMSTLLCQQSKDFKRFYVNENTLKDILQDRCKIWKSKKILFLRNVYF